jgi:tetratricopeptide (TPR) repeat protein
MAHNTSPSIRACRGERFDILRGRPIVLLLVATFAAAGFLRLDRFASAATGDRTREQDIKVEVYPAPPASDTVLKKIAELRKQVYPELMAQGDELVSRNNLDAARRIYVAAMGIETPDESSSPAASRIIATFSDESGDWLTPYRAWVATALPDPEKAARLDLAIGECLYRRQEHEKAIAALAVLVKGKTPVAQSAIMVSALSSLALGETEKAVQSLRAVSARPATEDIGAKALFLVGWIWLQEQDYEKAKLTFESVSAQYPHTAFASKSKALARRLTTLSN